MSAVGKKLLAMSSLFFATELVALADYVRVNAMFDISQYARPEWGRNWCAPTAVGNSLAWLAKEYGLNGLMRVNGTGDPLSAADVINILGRVDMNTDPNGGTTADNILAGKLSYIQRHGDRIRVETPPAGGVTKQWVKDQYAKGQDVEFGVGYYELGGDGKWHRTSGHVMTYGDNPGESAGGHAFSLAGLDDTHASDPYGDFYIWFTDPGRDDLAGQYGALAATQYSLTDYSGATWFNTASKYLMTYDANAFGDGTGGFLLDGYQGTGDFQGGAPRTKKTVLEAAWAESPVPEPAYTGGMALVLAALAAWRLRRRA